MAVKFWKCQTYKYCLNEWLVEDLTENTEVTRSNQTGTNFMVEWFFGLSLRMSFDALLKRIYLGGEGGGQQQSYILP